MGKEEIRREMKEPFDKALEQVMDIIEEARRTRSGRLDLIEGRLMELLKELGSSLIQKSVQATAPQSGHGSVKCRCEKKAGFARAGTFTRLKMLGWVAVPSTTYYCRHCKRSIRAEDELYGLSEGKYSRRVRVEVIHAGAVSFSFAEAEAQLARRGLTRSPGSYGWSPRRRA